MAYNESGKGADLPNLLASSKDLIKACESKSFHGEKWWLKKAYCESIVQCNPIDGLRLWHSAIRNDLEGILKDLYEIRRSQEFSTLDLTIVLLKFFTDVLIFYRYFPGLFRSVYLFYFENKRSKEAVNLVKSVLG